MVTTRSFAVLGLLLALGLAVFGMQIGRAVKKGRDFDRYFTVRGLSEKTVKATLVIWPVKYRVTAEDLPSLKHEMESAKAEVMNFLSANHIAPEEVTMGLSSISDTIGERRKSDAVVLPRYQAVVTVSVRSKNVDAVKLAIQKSDVLIEKGLPLIQGEYGERIEFLYDQVNTLKPPMIEEATANARLAAEKFAQDSKAKVGAIRKATQGVVEIEDRDVASPELKVVRVITTIEYFIE